MSEQKPHLRGRWSLNRHGYESPYMAHAFIEDENGAAVCGVWCPDGNAEQADRARLLAAAPELLAELENIANANWRTWDEDYRTAGDFVAWAQSRARYAIAKTKGEE